MPRWSCHISIGATGRACVDRHDRRVLAAHRERRDVPRLGRMRGGHLGHCVDELLPHRGRVLLNGVGAASMARGRVPAAPTVASRPSRPAPPSGWWSRHRCRSRTPSGAFSPPERPRANADPRRASVACRAMLLCVLLWAAPGREQQLVEYEDDVLPLLATHGVWSSGCARRTRRAGRSRCRSSTSPASRPSTTTWPTSRALGAVGSTGRRDRVHQVLRVDRVGP